jgi:dethiobiotin synthetase
VIRVVVVGTGTDVGKTHVGVALLEALGRHGVDAVGLKPVESGAGGAGWVGDGERLAEASLFHVKQAPYRLPHPLSPHLAAELVGARIRLATIVTWAARHIAAVQLVETAGGLLSPLTPRRTNLDLLRALLPARVLLVAPDRLGVLHDVAAASFALRARVPRARPVVALSAPQTPDSSTDRNARELLRLRRAHRVVCFPRAATDDVATRTAADALVAALGLAPRPRLAFTAPASSRRRPGPTHAG